MPVALLSSSQAPTACAMWGVMALDSVLHPAVLQACTRYWAVSRVATLAHAQ
jgi:hypothetical protein